MAVTQCQTTSFKLELLEGIHNFTTDTFWMALYGPSASLGNTTTSYTASGETTGGGYTAGGQALSIVAGYPQINGTGAVVTFNAPLWTGATFVTIGALIYNASKANRSVAVLNFGTTYSVTAGNFAVNMAPTDMNNAVVRIV